MFFFNLISFTFVGLCKSEEWDLHVKNDDFSQKKTILSFFVLQKKMSRKPQPHWFHSDDEPVRVCVEIDEIETSMRRRELKEKYIKFVKKGLEEKKSMVEHFTKEFPTIDPFVISTAVDSCHPNCTQSSMLFDYMFIHYRLDRMLKDVLIHIIDDGRCKGHRIYVNHCAGQCLDCGKGFCACFTVHCCCDAELIK